MLAQQHGQWAHAEYPALADKTVLILGYGSIGGAIERRLLPFEVDVIRVASRARPGGVHGVDELPELLPRADVVIVVTPLSAATRHLVDGRFLAAMRDGALLVNVSRGGVVDTDALLTELQRGRLRAALDVTDPSHCQAIIRCGACPAFSSRRTSAAIHPHSCRGPRTWSARRSPNSSPGSQSTASLPGLTSTIAVGA